MISISALVLLLSVTGRLREQKGIFDSPKVSSLTTLHYVLKNALLFYTVGGSGLASAAIASGGG